MARNENHDSPRKRFPSGEDGQEHAASSTAKEQYFVAHPQRRNPLFYIFNMFKHGKFAQTSAPEHLFAETNKTVTRQEQLAMFMMQSLGFMSSPMAKVGQVLETTVNIIVANGGVMMTLCRLLYSFLFFFRKDILVVPAQDSADYMSMIGLLDPRKDLVGAGRVGSTTSDHGDTDTSNDVFPCKAVGDRRIADLMLMAAKFAYENDALVKEVVTNSWKMNFVGFYNCWNEYQQRFNKQVYIFTDEAHDANAVVVAWRGTAPFNADDWITDVDFSWYDLQEDIGRVHLGFLECLGLGDRHNMDTFVKLRKNCRIQKEKNVRARELEPEGTQMSPSPPASGLSQDVIDAPEKILAYDDITKVVKDLLKKNPNAKLFITGHSLGGALSMLYAGMLYYFGEASVTDRIASVYTFGQPRVGDKTFCQFMLETLKIERYFRVVYSNDIVPRLPFDDSFFSYKHWGLCFYFTSSYTELTLKEEPNPNYFSLDIWRFISIHVNALYELLASLFIGCVHGPAYKESFASFWFRVLALLLPGFGAHSPVNYCNSVRLGNPMPLVANPVPYLE